MGYDFKYNKELKELTLKYINKERAIDVLIDIDKYEDEHNGEYHGYIENYENKKFSGFNPFLELNYYMYSIYACELGDKNCIYETYHFTPDPRTCREEMIITEWFRDKFIIRHYNHKRKPDCCIAYLDLTTREGVEKLFRHLNEATMTEVILRGSMITEQTEKAYFFPNAKVGNQYRFYKGTYGFIVYEIIEDKAIFNNDIINELNEKYEIHGDKCVDDIINDKI